MNLDRFAVGLRDPQSIPPVGYCAVCGGEIYPGEEVWGDYGELLHDECIAKYEDRRDDE
jgi:predicted nucleic acid-binding Zn ribbon protein